MACLKKRNKVYYAQIYVNGKQRRVCLETTNYQIAKEKLRQIETQQAMGKENPLPTRTPIGIIVERYIQHIRAHKTAKSAQTDVYYLRDAFGECCDSIKITSRKPSAKTRKRPIKPGIDKRHRPMAITAAYMEAITTSDIQTFIDSQVRSRGLSAKTANRYREIINRLFNWAMSQDLIRMPLDRNPAAKVQRHKEHAPTIRFLSLPQIDEQLHALRFNPRLQTMVAMLIYAGLRREELLWLAKDDVILPRLGSSRPSMIRVHAKTINGQYWEPKTKRNRAIPISHALRQYLERYTPLENEHSLYFPSPKGELWDPDNFSADLRKANKAASLQWACLDYRHTFGSQLAQKGVSLYKISTLMGNSPEICRRHYASLIPEALVDEVEFCNNSKISLTKKMSMS